MKTFIIACGNLSDLRLGLGVITITEYEGKFSQVCIILGATQASTQTFSLVAQQGHSSDVKICHKFETFHISRPYFIHRKYYAPASTSDTALMAIFQWQLSDRPLNILYDASHKYQGTKNISGLLSKYGPKVSHVHVQLSTQHDYYI